MPDRAEQTKVVRLIGASCTPVRQQTIPIKRDIAGSLKDATRDLHPADRHTWETFWATLFGEYEHLGVDLQDAA